MTGAEPFTQLVVLLAVVGLVAVLSNRLAHRVKLPAPALFLVCAAIAAKVVQALHGPSQHAVEHVVAVALACILFDGGMNAKQAWRERDLRSERITSDPAWSGTARGLWRVPEQPRQSVVRLRFKGGSG